jgi:predicted metal-dependent hydrolase
MARAPRGRSSVPDRPLHTDRCGEPPPALLRRGIEQFNQGNFFEQHETLEELWRAERDDVRYLYQGILLVGVGMYHLFARRNYHGAVTKLETGLRLLHWFRPACQGVDVDALITEAARARAAIIALGRARLAEFDPSLTPRVRLIGEPAGEQGELSRPQARPPDSALPRNRAGQP